MALIDGEHYPDVVRVAFAGIGHEVVGAVLLGGTEKLRGGEDYGVPRLRDARGGVRGRLRPRSSLDLSDEPIARPARAASSIASRVLARGIPYVGADFRFDPVRFEPFSRPALAVIGTGKRVGKTAVAGHIARLLSRDLFVVVVAMGRGGPQEPVVVEPEPDARGAARALTLRAARRLRLSRGRGFARASSRSEAAAAGGGLAGAPFYSNVSAAAELAASLAPDLVVFEGSGAAIPPVEAGKRILVAGAAQDPATVIGYLRRLPRSFSATSSSSPGCEEPLVDRGPGAESAACDRRGRATCPSLRRSSGRARSATISGRRVAYFSTAPPAAHARLREHLAPGARRRNRPHLREPLAPAGASRRPRLARGALGRRSTSSSSRRPRSTSSQRPPPSAECRARALRQRGAYRSTARVSTSACSSSPSHSKERARERPPPARLDALPRGGLIRVSRRSAGSSSRSLVLVGGATGTGKSTVATEVAHRLGITRVTSTDVVRQTMRAFFSARVHAVDPLLELRGRQGRLAGGGRQARSEPARAFSTRRATCSSASTRCSARALEEGYSLALEGVHIVPGTGAPVRTAPLVLPGAARDRGRGRARGPLLDARLRV